MSLLIIRLVLLNNARVHVLAETSCRPISECSMYLYMQNSEQFMCIYVSSFCKFHLVTISIHFLSYQCGTLSFTYCSIMLMVQIMMLLQSVNSCCLIGGAAKLDVAPYNFC